MQRQRLGFTRCECRANDCAFRVNVRSISRRDNNRLHHHVRRNQRRIELQALARHSCDIRDLLRRKTGKRDAHQIKSRLELNQTIPTLGVARRRACKSGLDQFHLNVCARQHGSVLIRDATVNCDCVEILCVNVESE